MRRTATVVAVMTAIIVAGAVAGFYHESIAQVVMGREGKTAVSDNRTAPKPEKLVLPKLTEAEKQRAIEIALSDPRVQELLEGKKYEIVDTGLWHATAEHGLKKLGAALKISFDKVYWIEYDWPYLEFDEKMTSFEEKTVHRSRMVKEIAICVHLESGRIASMHPAPLPPPSPG